MNNHEDGMEERLDSLMGGHQMLCDKIEKKDKSLPCTCQNADLYALVEFEKDLTRQEIIREIEKHKKYPVHKYNCPHIEPCIERENEALNEALDDIISTLTKKPNQ